MSKAATAKHTVPREKRSRLRFFKEVWLELTKVKWPTREDVVQLTLVVLLTILIVGVYVAILDFAVGTTFQAIGMYGRGA